jgi:hypothetical protein
MSGGTKGDTCELISVKTLRLELTMVAILSKKVVFEVVNELSKKLR